jgi:transketolase
MNLLSAISKKPKLKSVRQAFANELLKIAAKNPDIYVVSMGLAPSVLVDKFALTYPHRFVECGVAESNAAAVAAGLAKTGKTVFLVTYACFSPGINLSVIKQSICENHANVKVIGTHVGLMTTELGASHQMLEDVALMRSLPNMQVFSPVDSIETSKVIRAISKSPLPSYVRLVRATTPVVFDKKLKFVAGKSHVLKRGNEVTLISYGPILADIMQHKLPHSVEIINCSSVKPIDTDTIVKSVKKTGRCLVIEDHQKNGGFGEAVAAVLLVNGLAPKFVHLGIDNQFGQSGKDYHQLYDHYNIGTNSVINAINSFFL